MLVDSFFDVKLNYPFSMAQYLLSLSRKGEGGQGVFYVVATGADRWAKIMQCLALTAFVQIHHQ